MLYSTPACHVVDGAPAALGLILVVGSRKRADASPPSFISPGCFEVVHHAKDVVDGLDGESKVASDDIPTEATRRGYVLAEAWAEAAASHKAPQNLHRTAD